MRVRKIAMEGEAIAISGGPKDATIPVKASRLRELLGAQSLSTARATA